MKKKWIIATLATLLAGMMLFAGCGNSGDKTNENSKPDTANLRGGSVSPPTMSRGGADPSAGNGTDDFVPMDGITEEDIKGKSEGNLKGQDYTEYELQDGSRIFSLDGEGDLNEMNDAIEDSNRQNRNK